MQIIGLHTILYLIICHFAPVGEGQNEKKSKIFKIFFKKIWKFRFLSYLCNPKLKRWW